jgi:DNA-binding NtrC family response regulator
MIRKGEFLADLYHRLDCLRLLLPPLRDRPEDIEPTVRHILGEMASEGLSPRLTKKDWEALRDYDWPGNVRQLINLLRRSTLMEMGVAESLASEDDAKAVGRDVLRPESVDQILTDEEVRGIYARRAFELCGSVIKTTRERLQVGHSQTLKKLLSVPPPRAMLKE